MHRHTPNTGREGLPDLEEHHRQSVLALLGQFVRHAGDGGMEEEGDEMLVSTLGADLLQGRDVGSTVFQLGDKQGVTGTQQDEVRQQAASPAVAVAEGMQILVVTVPLGSDYHRMMSVVESPLGR